MLSICINNVHAFTINLLQSCEVDEDDDDDDVKLPTCSCSLAAQSIYLTIHTVSGPSHGLLTDRLLRLAPWIDEVWHLPTMIII